MNFFALTEEISWPALTGIRASQKFCRFLSRLSRSKPNAEQNGSPDMQRNEFPRPWTTKGSPDDEGTQQLAGIRPAKRGHKLVAPPQRIRARSGLWSGRSLPARELGKSRNPYGQNKRAFIILFPPTW
jgi:hypothetical protein